MIVWRTHICYKRVPAGDLFQFATIQFTLLLSGRWLLGQKRDSCNVENSCPVECYAEPLGIFKTTKNSLRAYETPCTSYPTTQRNIPQDFRVQQKNCVNLKYRLYRIISVVICCTVLYTTIIDSLEIFALLGCYAA